MQEVRFSGWHGVGLAGDAYGLPDDPAVVLLPPIGQAGSFWCEAAKALAEAGRYAICLDLRGHGASDHAADGRYDLDAHVGDLQAVLAALPNRAFVVGAGLGALIALAAVGEGPPHLSSGVALIDVSVSFDNANYERMAKALADRTRAGEAEDIRAALSAAHPGEDAPAVGEPLLAAFDVGPEGALAWKGDPRALSGTELLSQIDRLKAAAANIKVPVTILRGTRNATISAEAVRELSDLIPGSELTEIEGAGHLVAFDHADAFNAVLLDFIERKAPRQPLSYIGGSEPRVLRDALGCFSTGVTVVTTVDPDGKPVGLTANSFTSVSLDPPLVLFSLARTSYNLPVFEKAGRFAINVLHIGQQPLSNRFVQRDVDRFEGVDWSYKSESGSPIIAGALASFDCSTHAVHDGGDHLIFIGKVEQAWFEPHRDPLLYFRGRYRRLHFS